MIHKLYNLDNIHYAFLSPYCKVIRDTDNGISIINRITNQSVEFRGTVEALDMFRKSFVLNMGMSYERLSSFFSEFDHCTDETWLELIQGGFLE